MTKFFMFTIKAPDFNLEATLESGQVFGFQKSPDGFYEGTIDGREVRLRQDLNFLQVQNHSQKSTEPKVRHFFDLDRDLNPVYEILNKEEPLAKILQKFRGLRLIRQNSWEALACFIISSNNNVKRIQGIWKNLTSRLSADGFSFPKPFEIAKSHERMLRELGLGYRAPFLFRSAQFLAHNPVSLDLIREAEYSEARHRLLQFPGIGPKVADCALLYGFQKYEAFPVDVWILRVMRKLYFRNRKVSEEKIHGFGQKRWGNLAGYVQQYLFHGARSGLFDL